LFDVPPAALWEALSRTDRYRSWWSWLRRFDGPGLVEGTTTRCEVRAPLPYSLRFDVVVTRVVPARAVDATITGDIAGPAALAIEANGAGSAASLEWTVELRDPSLRAAALLGRPVMQWAHDRVVATGVEEFRRRALRPDLGPVGSEAS
jgi:uncharacterized protein YndB with AHSA1/START domain